MSATHSTISGSRPSALTKSATLEAGALRQSVPQKHPDTEVGEKALDISVKIIGRRPAWQIVDLAELWRYRELLVFLAWRDVTIRFKQTILGFAWALFQPLATMLVFALFFGRLGGLNTSIPHYSLFVFAGVLPWTFFANAVTFAGHSIVTNERLITKIYFPRLLIPLAAMGAPLFDFFIAGVLMVGMMFWYGVAPGWSVLMLPLLLLLLIVAATGFGVFLAALIVAQRDFKFILNFSIQLWMFATPCIYLKSNAFGPLAHQWLPFNPAYGLILNFRQALLNGPIDWYALGVSTAVSVFMLLFGLVYFRRVERSFADVI
jgi:lipopolysaccharide transport system permease protein